MENKILEEICLQIQMYYNNIITLPGIFGKDDNEQFINAWLAYLLDPAKNGFNLEPIKALLNLVDEKHAAELDGKISIKAEYSFIDGRRIDIFITTENLVIGIENKLWSGEQENQTNDYYESIKKIAEGPPKRIPICIFLKPEFNETAPQNENFKTVTYKDLCDAFKMIPYSLRRDNRKSQFFYEFIFYVEEKLMSNTSTGFPEINEAARIYRDYEESINAASDSYNNYNKSLADWLIEQIKILSNEKFHFCGTPKKGWWIIVEDDKWRNFDFHFELNWYEKPNIAGLGKIYLSAHLETADESVKEYFGKSGLKLSEDVISIDFSTEEKSMESLKLIVDKLLSDEFQKWAKIANELI